MTKTYLDNNLDDSVLQGNQIGFSIKAVTDYTSFNQKVVKYRYRYCGTPLYCADENNAILPYYDSDNILKYNFIEIEDYTNNDYLDIISIVPRFETDMLLQIEFEAYQDDDKTWSQVARSPFFIAFHNEIPKISLRSVEWMEDSIQYIGSIDEIGFFKPANDTIHNESAWRKYCEYFYNVFKVDNIELKLLHYTNSKGSADREVSILHLDSNELYNLYSKTIQGVLLETNVNGSNYYQLQISASLSNSTTADYKLKFPQEKNNILSSIVLLPIKVPSFQIKRRGTKTHMSDIDKTIGTYVTGAGMFNHSNLVGVQPGQNPKLDSALGHSIALYDTHVPEGQEIASNSPSIGFFDEAHNELGSIKYDPQKSGLVFTPIAEITSNSIILTNEEGDKGIITLARDSDGNVNLDFHIIKKTSD